MTWHVRTTFLPAYAGTSEPLASRLPKEIAKLRSSLTISTTRWSFTTLSVLESWIAERTAMTQHQETMPRTRVTLVMETSTNRDEWNAWEIVDKVPPSVRLEEPRSSLRDPPRGSTSVSCPGSSVADGPEQTLIPGLEETQDET